MNFVYDLLPWEQIFWGSGAGFVITAASTVLAWLRGRRVGAIRATLLALFAVVAAVPWLTLPFFGERLRRGATTNIATTSPDATWPELRSRRYTADQAMVAQAVIASANDLGWPIVNETETTFALEVPVVGGVFRDDFRVTLTPENAQTTVDADSRARVGRGDFGTNRRHVVQFFVVLDSHLAAQQP